MAELAIVRHVKSSSEAGLGKRCGLWRRGEQGREIQVTQQCNNAGKRQGAAARTVTFWAVARQLRREAPQSSSLSRDSSLAPLFCLALLNGRQCLWPTPSGTSPQEKLWEHKCETEVFQRLPDLNQSHGDKTDRI